jgi:hypothetical protein
MLANVIGPVVVQQFVQYISFCGTCWSDSDSSMTTSASPAGVLNFLLMK